MDAESQYIEELKAEVPTSIQVQAYELALALLREHNLAKNQIIRELLDWIDSEFRIDQYPPNSPGKQLWDRAQDAIK